MSTVNWKINENSKIIGQPPDMKVDLKKHQLAMLYRCLTIEKNIYKSPRNYNYGIMSDKPGAGKTAVIISLILSDKTLCGKTQNLIVVPQNIHSQWINEFKKFSGDSLNVKSFIDYSEISNLFFDTSILYEYDVFITTTLYYDMIINVLRQNNLPIKRLIFDEIDTASSSVLKNIEEKYSYDIKRATSVDESEVKENYTKADNKLIWFISASFDNCVKETGFTFRNINVPIEKLSEIMCKCEDSFIDNNFKIEEPEYEIKHCQDLSDDYFECLSPSQLDHINSISFQNISSKITNKVATNSHDILKIIINDYNETINKDMETIKSFRTPLMKVKNHDIIEIKEKNIIFCKKLLDMCHSIKCSNVCIDKVKCIIEKINAIKYSNTKLFNLDEIFKNIRKDKDKVLIFSDFTGSFKQVSSILDKYDLKYTELDGGNVNSIDLSIDKYKNQDTVVLMIDSSSQGCGMNLENTTHLIFLHKTGEILHNQIIGRALRPGRTTKLKIITLLNNNELID